MSPLLLAQAEGAPPDFFASAWLPILVTVVIFYLLLIRPEARKKKELEDQIKSLKKHDRVLTSGGIIGTVWSMKDNEIVLQVDDNNKTRIRFARNAVVQVLAREGKEPASETAEEGKEGAGRVQTA